jgi:hypothetical protein
MKKILGTIAQFVLFFVTFAVGSFLVPLHLRQVLSTTPQGTRIFIWDGVVLMIALFVLILVIEAVRKRIAAAGAWTTIAFLLAAAAGFAAKLGFLTIER